MEMIKEAVTELKETLEKASKDLGFINQMIEKINEAAKMVCV